jgi:hypothetical protein
MARDRRDELRARVFISCGQSKQSDEVATAGEVARRLQELGFDPYIAVEEQTLRGLKENIFEQLGTSEYLVFVDFKRELLSSADPPVHRGSLFSHQELALASYLNIPVLAFQESGVKRDDGILQFLQANATPFTDRNLLPNVIADEVRRRAWDPHMRNELALERDPEQRGDSLFDKDTHAGFFHIGVRNRHNSKTATNCYVYLEKATMLDPPTAIDCPAAELVWAGYSLPNVRIPPGTARKFDAFFIRHDVPSKLQFHTFSTSPEFIPSVEGAGRYELTYLVVADSFPTARGSFILTLGTSLAATTLKSKTGELET